MKFPWFFLATVFLSGAAEATDYYVSSSGFGALCSEVQPCREISQALLKVEPGDRVLVGNGRYQGFTVRQKSGTASKPIEIKATGNDVVVLRTTDRPDNRDNILISFSDHFIIDGVKSYDAPRAGLRVDTSHHVTVRNCTFGDNGKWGIFTNHSNSIVIESNTTFGSKIEHGIYFSNSADNPIIRRNLIYNNIRNGIHMNGDLSAGGAQGVVGDGVISGARVEANIIFNNGVQGGGGINMDGVQNSTIVNNLLYDNHASGIIAYRIDGGDGPRGLTIAHNTIDMANDARYALQLSETTGSIVVRNNVLSTRSSRRGGLAYGLEADVPNVSSRNNIFVGNPIVAFNDWEIRKSLASWQAESNRNEIASFVSSNSALFVRPDALNLFDRNYQLRGNSPAVDNGITVSGVSEDIVKNPRQIGRAPDVGAYEVLSRKKGIVAPLLILLDD